MTVLTLPNYHAANQQKDVPNPPGCLTPIATRQCATLPRRLSGPGKLPAPAPPRRDPRTTLSVGRARAKSMVAGLENGGEKDDDDTPNHTKCNSIESINHAMHSSMSTPTTQGPGTPTQPRTASIKSRPTSSRITAAELEELFSRQQGSDTNTRFSTMMTTSRFQSGLDSGAPTPPASPNKGPLVYASVADMKRKQRVKNGTLKGRPVAIPTVQSELKRSFHSTPDLASGLNNSTNSVTWAAAFKNHRSQDDMHNIHSSLSRLNLPPPTCPPPPIPAVGQVVKVDVKSEYESTVNIQKQIQQRAQQQLLQQQQQQAAVVQETELMSSFKPETNAKLYASPQDLKNVAFKAKIDATQQGTTNNNGTLRPKTNGTTPNNVSPYAQPGVPGALISQSQNGVGTPPVIPDPDYSLSESDGEEDNSVRQVKIVPAAPPIKIEVNGHTNNNNNAGMAAETSGNSNTR